MHFYCFLPFYQLISLIHGFNYLCNLCNLLTTIVAHPGTRTWCHAFTVVGDVLLAILTDRSSLKQKYFRL